MKYIQLFESFEAKQTMTVLIEHLFKIRDLAHKDHLVPTKTEGSYAQHKALEDFYTSILPLIDELAETWQGTIEELMPLNFNNQTGLEKADIETLKSVRTFCQQCNSQLDDSFSHIKNILDEICGVISQTIYKLKFLN
jgi:hypothetical protein